MRIGVLCEGEMTDEPVIRLLLEHVFPNHEFLVRGVSKAVIFKSCDYELAKLFEAGAERTLIIWDLLPIGYKMAVLSQKQFERPSRLEQRQMLLEHLCRSDLLPNH